MYFVHKHVETSLNCLHEQTTFFNDVFEMGSIGSNYFFLQGHLIANYYIFNYLLFCMQIYF